MFWRESKEKIAMLDFHGLGKVFAGVGEEARRGFLSRVRSWSELRS